MMGRVRCREKQTLMSIEGTKSSGLSENVSEVETSGLNEINNLLSTGKELFQRIKREDELAKKNKPFKVKK